ncbi:hypothetical protein ADIARSV_1295 [Arcticibacter svalbardensis MN12-7]|uniref:Outer membrane protein n=2 Tax=Arcticibacter TaxID=1288026 RepID=R9GUR8_9SPHI|nr:hypothetical protein ADIARSV_1295 [Arcticibacter svalbardensis MN12-7]
MLIILSGCEKYLEQTPDQRSTLNTTEKISELLATAYPKGDYITFAESISDNAGDKGGGMVDVKNQSPYLFNDVQSKEEGSPDYYWNACYAAIAASNEALHALDLLPEEAATANLRGEALVARAYAHFMLVTFFSKAYNQATASSDPGIPYVTSPEHVVTAKYERKTVQYVYEMIEKDLTEGLPLIKDSYYKIPKFHFNSIAANAFATRFYLFKKDYAKVLTYANAAFPTGTIAANLRPINSTYLALTYYELQSTYTQSTENANLLLVETPSYWGRNFASYRYGLSVSVLTDALGIKNPVRTGLAYQVYGGTEFVYNIPKFYEHFVREDANSQIGDAYNMVPLFTSEEVLFNQAEAYVELGNYQEAVNLVNVFLSTRIEDYDPGSDELTTSKALTYYNSLDIKTALIQTILNFKRGEFMHEGLRWFDMLRHNIPVSHNILGTTTPIILGANDPRRVFQIPQEAAQAGIELNPR